MAAKGPEAKRASSKSKGVTPPRPVDGPASRPSKHSPVNLSRLAEHLELSPTTISLVLNDSPAGRAIPQRTRDRVTEAAERLGYRPNFFARSLRTSSSMSVGVLCPDLSEGYFTQVMSGVEERLMKTGYFYLTASHHWDEKLIARYSQMLQERAVDGFLLLNTPSSIETARPVVTISSDRNSANQTNFALDHDAAAVLALGHLYELGHRRIAFVRGPKQIVDSQFRWKGIERAAKAFELKVDPRLCIQLEDARSTPQVGYEAVVKLIARKKAFTAIFCFNDMSAIGAMSALRDQGFSVPREVSVVGFDDIVGASFQSPKLTTVRQPLREMGMEGAGMLLEKIKAPAGDYPSEVLMQPRLIVRESTAAVLDPLPGKIKH